MDKCECCDEKHDGSFGSGRFCNQGCSSRYSTKAKRKEINRKVSIKMTQYKKKKVKCKMCGNIFLKSKKSKGYCSRSCANKDVTPERLRKVRESSKKCHKGKNKEPKNILDLSSRTSRKIIKRLMDEEGLSCSRCNWNKSTCDLHHINGRKIKDPNNHSNLTFICPNCHRLFHNGKIDESDVVTLEKQIGDKWRNYYFG